jgi:signal transduction histidine kinase
VNLSAIFVRDYLLDPAPERAHDYRRRIVGFRASSDVEFNELQVMMRGRDNISQRLPGLKTRLDDYWQAVDPLFDWSASEKSQASAQFLRTQVLPRREAVLAITSELEELNNAAMAAQRSEVTLQQSQLRSDLYKLLWPSLLLGLVVAMTAVFRLRHLERRAEEQRLQAATADQQMRQLSQQIVAAQEDERTRLSRELHDDVGQMLTALRMELGTIDRLRMPSDQLIARSVSEARQLVDTMVRTVRDLALGLRPSMLDDLGLQAAVEWQARDFTRRYDLPVIVKVIGDMTALPDPYRTCLYRVVQEALTNCARHANASCLRISIERQLHDIELQIVDDGLGFDVSRRRCGFGLHGVEERVKELGGETHIRSVKGAGTTLRIVLPTGATPGVEGSDLARAAG